MLNNYDLNEDTFESQLKISPLLSEKNPFKKFMYDLENKTQHGWLYKIFCIICLCYSVGMQIWVFMYNNQYSWATMPLTISLCVYIFLNYSYIFSRNEESIVNKIKNTYWQIFFIIYISILLGILIINYIISPSNNPWYIKFSLDNYFFIYSITVGFLIHVVFLFNNTFILYMYFQAILGSQGEQKRFYILANLLSPVICVAIIWATYDSFLTKKYNIFFQSLCLFFEGFLSYTVLYIFSIFSLYIFRKFSLYINRFYK